MFTETLTQRQAISNGIPPQTLNSSRAFTNAVDMSHSKRALFTVYIGAVTSGSISCWLQESADNSSWTANDTAGAFSGSGGNNVSQTGLTTSNSIITFEVRADQLTPGKRYVRLEVKEVNGSATYVCATAVGDEGDQKPNNQFNGTAVATQNVVS